MGLPHDLGLDYSIELFGLEVALGMFRMKLNEVGVSFGRLTEAQYWGVRAMFLNGDVRGYLVRLVDAGALTERQALEFARRGKATGAIKFQAPIVKQEAIHKWVPGDHYYALGEKFNTMAEAEAHLERNGFKCLGLRETFVYPGDGS